MTEKQRRTYGFTLVEILVVIGIVGIIAAILLPVMARARDRARAATCAGNLRQIGLAMSMYVKDHNNTHPPVGDVANNCSWVDSVVTYVKSPSIFECPSAEHGKYMPGCVEAYHGDGYVEYFNGSYILNVFRNTPLNPIRDSRIRYPSETIWVSEGTARYGVLSYTDGYVLNPENIQTTSFQFRHNRGANNLFVDGHVKWLSLSTMANINLWTLK